MPLNGSSSSRMDGIVHQCAGDLDPLAHPLGVASRSARPARVREVHGCDGLLDRGVDEGEPVEHGVHAHELPPGEEGIERLPLGNDADFAVDVRVLPGALAVDLDQARGRPRKPAISRRSVVLPAPLGPSSPSRPRGARRRCRSPPPRCRTTWTRSQDGCAHRPRAHVADPPAADAGARRVRHPRRRPRTGRGEPARPRRPAPRYWLRRRVRPEHPIGEPAQCVERVEELHPHDPHPSQRVGEDLAHDA